MPKRRRAREFKRRLARAIAQAEAEFAPAAPLPSDPLDDFYWREHEEGGWCCLDCSPNHPDRLLNDALEEIDAYLNRRTAHA
jgi:hypothetical protein